MTQTKLHRLWLTTLRGLAAVGRCWIHVVVPLLTDLLFAGAIFAVGCSYWIERTLSLEGLAILVTYAAGGQVLALLLTRKRMYDLRTSALRAAVGALAAGVGYATTRGLLGPEVVSRGSFASLLAVGAVGHVLRHWAVLRQADTPARNLEPLRWALLLTVLLTLHRPLLTAGSLGAGDSYWYRIMSADFVAQFRAGIFPVFSGQSLYAFNGAVSPIRLAPALQHLAGLIDLITLHSLALNALVNLALAWSYCGGGIVSYLCLRRMDPGAPWFALLLSLLYSSSPGVLALAYTGDLYMSVVALPFIPVVFYGAWRTLQSGDRAGLLTMIGGAAALWYCHPPIAFWCTLLAALTQVGRLPGEWRRKRLWLDWLVGMATFAVLALYCFVSVGSLGLPSPTTARPVLLENLQVAFPASFKPVSDAAVSLTDYQLGWALWTALAIALLLGCFTCRPRRPFVLLFLAVLAVLAVLEPVRGVYDRFWLTAPQFVSDITFMWPMQRLYAILAALVAFVAFAALAPFAARRPRWASVFFVPLLAGAAWSGLESLKFRQRGLTGTTKPAQARNQMRPQNAILTRYAFNPFREMPPYFSHGYIDPTLANRLLDRTSLAELASNRAAIESGDTALGAVVSEGEVKMYTQPPLSGFVAEPGRRYALQIDFLDTTNLGAMTVTGPRMYRLYWLPHSGYNTVTTSPSHAFGSLPGLSRTIPLWTDGDAREGITFQFVPNDKPLPDPLPTLARYRIREYDPARLPIVVDNLTPYRARVVSAGPAYLETPRLFTVGYRAKVNGTTVPVAKSPDALVMIPVPTGTSSVELSFPGAWYLQTAFWVTFAGWVALLTAGARRLLRSESRAAATGHL